MKIVVITPTTGIDLVNRAITSVKNQTIPTEHLLVIDGAQASKSYPVADPKMVITLPENTGRHNGVRWNGHRIYAGVSFLVNADYVLFLDEDNWFADNHVESMVKHIEENNLDWCYSLRKIYNEDGKFECVDDCESLGKWPTFYDHTLNFVDTNCYCVKGELLPYVAPHFYLPAIGDGPDCILNAAAINTLRVLIVEVELRLPVAPAEDLMPSKIARPVSAPVVVYVPSRCSHSLEEGLAVSSAAAPEEPIGLVALLKALITPS